MTLQCGILVYCIKIHLLLPVACSCIHQNLFVSECGGKNFHFVHSSADPKSVAVGTIRSAFEYGGQKCSACSRMYIPESIWPEVKQKMLDIHKDIKLGSCLDNKIFLSAVIDDKVFVIPYGFYILYFAHLATCIPIKNRKLNLILKLLVICSIFQSKNQNLNVISISSVFMSRQFFP